MVCLGSDGAVATSSGNSFRIRVGHKINMGPLLAPA